jgi:hypothetical protein
VDGIREVLTARTTTNWPAIWGGAAIAVALVGMAGGLIGFQLSTLNENIHNHVGLDGHSPTMVAHARTAEQINTLRADIAHGQTLHDEHTRQIAAASVESADRRIAIRDDLQKSIDELWEHTEGRFTRADWERESERLTALFVRIEDKLDALAAHHNGN